MISQNSEIFGNQKSYKEVGPKYLGESGNSDGLRDIQIIHFIELSIDKQKFGLLGEVDGL